MTEEQDEFASFDDAPQRPRKRGSQPPKRLKKVEEEPASTAGSRGSGSRSRSTSGRASSARSKKAAAPVEDERKQGKAARKAAEKRRKQFYFYPMLGVCLISGIVTIMLVGCEIGKSLGAGKAVATWSDLGYLPLPELDSKDKTVSSRWAWNEKVSHLRPKAHADLGPKHVDGMVFWLYNGGIPIVFIEIAWFKENGETFYEVVYMENLLDNKPLYPYKKVTDPDTGASRLVRAIPLLKNTPDGFLVIESDVQKRIDEKKAAEAETGTGAN